MSVASAVSPLRWAFAAASPAGERARLSILILHRVLADPDPLFPGEMDARRFDRLCGWLRRWFNVLPLDAAVRRLAARTLPARALALTFDDGYADNHDVALPILRRHGMTATFFVATGFLDGGRMWNDTIIEALRRTAARRIELPGIGAWETDDGSPAARRRVIDAAIGAVKHLAPALRGDAVSMVERQAGVALPDDLMMRSDQVVALHRAGMQIGAHTVTHPILALLDPPAIEREIVGSRDTLSSLIGQRVTLFAYPNGRPDDDYGAAAVRAVAACGFDAAVSTAWGAADARSDRLQLPRFTPWDRSRARFGVRLLANLRRPAARTVAVAVAQPAMR